jgi:hypothetical protein
VPKFDSSSTQSLIYAEQLSANEPPCLIYVNGPQNIRDLNDGVLNYYLVQSSVDVEAFDNTLPLSDCHHQAKNTRAKLKDVVTDANDNGIAYELEITIARVHKCHPELFDDPALEEEGAKELKTRENRRTAARSYRKLGRQIRGHVKPDLIQKSFLASLEVPGEMDYDA